MDQSPFPCSSLTLRESLACSLCTLQNQLWLSKKMLKHGLLGRRLIREAFERAIRQGTRDNENWNLLCPKTFPKRTLSPSPVSVRIPWATRKAWFVAVKKMETTLTQRKLFKSRSVCAMEKYATKIKIMVKEIKAVLAWEKKERKTTCKRDVREHSGGWERPRP